MNAKECFAILHPAECPDWTEVGLNFTKDAIISGQLEKFLNQIVDGVFCTDRETVNTISRVLFTQCWEPLLFDRIVYVALSENFDVIARKRFAKEFAPFLREIIIPQRVVVPQD